MRNTGRWLSSLAFGFAFVIAIAADRESLYVGQHKLTADAVGAKTKGVGKVVGQNSDGYFRVVPLKGHSLVALEKALKGEFELVLPGDANEVKRSNLRSVESHIKYKKGAFMIKTGRQPDEEEAEEVGVDFYEALEYYLEPRVDPATGELDHDAYIKAVEHRDAMPPATADMIDPYRNQTAVPAAWAFVGPKNLAVPYQQYYGSTNLSGRKSFVAPAPSNTNIGYIASAGGGIWKTTDNYVTFTPKSDGWKFLHTSCVAVDPTNPNIVYAGTGDYEGFFTRQTFGIMKSTNGGTSWTNYGAANFGDSVVTRIVIDPTTPSTVIALTAGPSGDIWRSTNSGVTWTATNAPDADWQDIDRTTSGYWIAVTGDGDHIYFSSSGATWSGLTNPTGSGGGKWDIACSKNDYRRAYMIQSNGKVFRTTDNFVSWTDITAAHDAGNSNPSYNKSQITYDMYIETGIADANNDIVYTGLITVSHSRNNGSTWSDLTRSFESNSKWHNDQHNATMWPSNTNGLLIVGDGGLAYVRSDTGSVTDLQVNDGICDTQFYYIAVHPTDSLRAIGGTQDNASPMQRGANPNSNTQWFNAFAGDGTGCGFNLANPAIHYSSSQNGNFYRYDSAGDTSATSIGFGGGPFVTPLVMGGASRNTPTAISGSSMRKYSSGTTWTSHPTGGGTLRSLEVARSSGNIIYTGATNGDVFRTANFGTSFTKIDGTTLPNRAVGNFAESFATSNWVICGLMGSGFADGAWRCTNTAAASPTWVNISGSGATSLPAMPINDMERDPTNISVYYAATDVGVFVSPNEGANWYNMNAMGLPNVHVNDLWIYSSGGTNFLYAGTFGRGIWRCFLSSRNLTSLLVSKSSIWGGQQNTLTVKMNGTAPPGSVATLSDNSGNVSIPASVTFPVGSTQVGFTAFTTNPTANQTVTVTANCWGSTVSNSFILYNIPAFTYTPESANIYGGRRFNATIQMPSPNPITVVYTFSDNAAQIGSPSATAIYAGQSSKTVPLYALTVLSTLNATISCRLANTIVTSNISVHPAPDVSSVAVSPSSVVGGNPSTGTVNMTFAGGGGPQVISLTDSSTIVTTPSTVTIPNGATSANFAISTSAVSASYNVTVRARLRSISKTTTLNVHP